MIQHVGECCRRVNTGMRQRFVIDLTIRQNRGAIA